MRKITTSFQATDFCCNFFGNIEKGYVERSSISGVHLHLNLR